MSFQTVKADLEVKRPTMNKLCSMSQDLLSSVKNKEVASKLEARLDSFAQRWDRLIQSLESSSSQVLTSPHQCVISCNRDDWQSYIWLIYQACVFTDKWVWVFFLFFVWVKSVQHANTLRSHLCCYKNSAVMKLESWKPQLWHKMT